MIALLELEIRPAQQSNAYIKLTSIIFYDVLLVSRFARNNTKFHSTVFVESSVSLKKLVDSNQRNVRKNKHGYFNASVALLGLPRFLTERNQSHCLKAMC